MKTATCPHSRQRSEGGVWICQSCGAEVPPNPMVFDRMVSDGVPPLGVTDAMLWEGNHNQFAEKPNDGSYYASLAKQRGLKSTKGKIYMPGLAAFPGDPEAYVETRGDIKRLCEKRNWGCTGLVNHQMSNDYPLPPSIELDEDLVTEEVQGIMEATPGLVTNEREKLDLADKIRSKRKRKK